MLIEDVGDTDKGEVDAVVKTVEAVVKIMMVVVEEQL